jgi:L-lactate dehydrogenase (cytochrome)
MAAVISYEEVSRHCTDEDCWVILGGVVYDLGHFAHEHPGGADLITMYAGRDATKEFIEAHPLSIIRSTLPDKGAAERMGTIDTASLPPEALLPRGTGGASWLEWLLGGWWTAATTAAAVHTAPAAGGSGDSVEGVVAAAGVAGNDLPPLQAILNLHDIEAVAQRAMVRGGKQHAWDYYSSGAEDELTYRENVCAFQRIWLKPRILVDVKEVDTSTTLLGHRSEVLFMLIYTIIHKYSCRMGFLAEILLRVPS